jgi:hypothetical protein
VAGVDLLAEPLQVVVRLLRFSPLVPSRSNRYGHGVEAEAVEAEVEPEADDVEHPLGDLGVVVVQVGWWWKNRCQ